MEWFWNFVWSIIVLSPLLVLLSRWNNSRSKRLPPGPRGWPLFGNVFSLGMLPHRSLIKLKQQYGPVIWLNLGSTQTMVLQSANAAAELYKNPDFSGRNVLDIMYSHGYYQSSMVFAPFGGYWRALKRLYTAEMFGSKRMNDTLSIRQKCVNDILSWIAKEADLKHEIQLMKFVFPTLFNLIGNIMLSRDLVDPYSEMSSEFYTAMEGITDCVGRPNVSDLFPWLSGLDLQGLRKKMDKHFSKAFEIATGFIKERIEERRQGKERRNDFLDALLDFEGNGKDEPANLSEQNISIFVVEVFMAGTETVSTTIEWVMSEVTRNPETIVKIKDELNEVIGPNKKVEENDCDNLPYLQAVVKETFRLHPPGPLLVPRKAIQDTNFMGYNIPKDTQVLVNAWGIGRDPEYFDDPMRFKPERFLGSNIDYKGQNFELIPFGAGRRICPGLPLSHRMIPHIAGSLLHEFDWELKDYVSPEMDIKETTGISAKRLEHFKAIPKRAVRCVTLKRPDFGKT